MPKISRAIVVACLASQGVAAHGSGTGVAGGRRVETGLSTRLTPADDRMNNPRETGGAGPASSSPAGYDRAVKSPPWQACEVVWRPDPAAPGPFGFIPTEWDVRPELLPTTWDVRIVFASARQHRWEAAWP